MLTLPDGSKPLLELMLTYHKDGTVTIIWEQFHKRYPSHTLRWRHNGHDNVSNHQPRDYFLNLLFRHRSKKTSKLRVTGLCVGNSPGTGEFPAQMASNAENVSIWWRHHEITKINLKNTYLKFYSNLMAANELKAVPRWSIIRSKSAPDWSGLIIRKWVITYIRESR